jgi:nucleoside-diphosphate-sugar epimerase
MVIRDRERESAEHAIGPERLSGGRPDSHGYTATEKQALTMASILVTGATGFIGTHLTRRLVELGHAVRCLVRQKSNRAPLSDLDIEWIPGDLSDPLGLARAMRGVDRVFHLGGLTSAFRRSALMRVNGQGSAHVAWACAAQPSPPELIFVSSVAAAGPAPDHRPRTEQDPARPVSNYGRSKRAGELAVEQFADRVPITIVRPGIVFGEYGREMVLMFRYVYRFRTHAVPGLKPFPLSVIYVADLVDLLLSAADRGRRLAPGGSAAVAGQGYYFACLPECPDYLQFGRLLQQAMERSAVLYLYFPEPFPWLVGGVHELWDRLRGVTTNLNLDKIREAMAGSWACSCAAAQRDLAFQPGQPLVEQLRATANWYRQHGWL